MTHVLPQQLLYCFTWSSNQFLNSTFYLFFFFRVFYLSTQFLSVLTLESSTIHWLTCFWVSGSFLCFFGCCKCWLRLHKPCHVPHESRITTWATIVKERPFSVSKEWVRSWSHAFLITNYKTLTKNLLAAIPE